ncbi:MAG: PEGA domain-containing protein, partial [Thermoplasmatales archaeon]|nr:PEGA domain-containing protein [Thermoplasmatales archaeon]
SITTENGTFNITLISGTYEIEVSANGYSTYLKNVTVSGTTSKLTSLTIILQKKPSSIPFWLIIAVMLTVIVAVIAIVVTFVIKSRKTEPK